MHAFDSTVRCFRLNRVSPTKTVFIGRVYECTWQMNMMLLIREGNSTHRTGRSSFRISAVFAIIELTICTRESYLCTTWTTAATENPGTRMWMQYAIVNRSPTHYGNAIFFFFRIFSIFLLVSRRKMRERDVSAAHAHLLCPVCKFDVIIYLFRRCRKSTNINNYLLISASVSWAHALRCSWNVHNGKLTLIIILVFFFFEKWHGSPNTVEIVCAHTQRHKSAWATQTTN